MKNRIFFGKSILVGTIVASLAGCAAPDGNGPSNAATQGVVGAGVGAIAGLVLCKAVGGSDVACRNAAVLAGAAGAYIGWRHGKEQDLAQAKALEQSLHSAGLPVVTDTANLNKADGSGNAQTVTAWKGTTVGLPKGMLAAKSPDLQKSVELSGQAAALNSANATWRKPACSKPFAIPPQPANSSTHVRRLSVPTSRDSLSTPAMAGAFCLI
jgi:hypothetical protein